MLTLTFDGSLATLTLDDGKGNAIGTKLLLELERALDEAAKARALIIRGREKVFCGGLDLPDLLPRGRHEIYDFFALFDRVHEKLLRFPRPIVTCCRGSAVAGGAILLAAGDARLATPSGKVGITETNLGFSFPTAALELVRVAIGDQRLAEAAQFGRLYDGEERLRIGFVTEVVEADQIDARAIAIATEFAKPDPDAVAQVRLQVRRSALDRVRDYAEADRRIFVEGWFAPFAQAAVKSVVDRLSARG
jgi:enoyl-CoA hydratase